LRKLNHVKPLFIFLIFLIRSSKYFAVLVIHSESGKSIVD
jgi:hypothetical protein